ncbi:unnamed protein product [Pleuronectes platessa]|uniref:Uncharacterized protein n=1 Tax=Pleuronectes platessa TaxID=8262 RepID=A0A9N7U1R5_PLEPL|nr:unnamed protein product [Pleuronectes platessa]
MGREVFCSSLFDSTRDNKKRTWSEHVKIKSLPTLFELAPEQGTLYSPNILLPRARVCIEMLRSEARVMEGLRSLHIETFYIHDIRSQRSAVRLGLCRGIRCPGQSVWINNLETDHRYSSWPYNVQSCPDHVSRSHQTDPQELSQFDVPPDKSALYVNHVPIGGTAECWDVVKMLEKRFLRGGQQRAWSDSATQQQEG